MIQHYVAIRAETAKDPDKVEVALADAGNRRGFVWQRVPSRLPSHVLYGEVELAPMLADLQALPRRISRVHPTG